MFRTIVMVMLFIGTVFVQSGCNAMRESSRQMVDVFKPSDYAEWSDDPWVRQAGVEARGNRPRESTGEPPWLYNTLTSQRARDIDRNMGIDVE